MFGFRYPSEIFIFLKIWLPVIRKTSRSSVNIYWVRSFGNTLLDGCKRDNWFLPLENVERSFELCVLNSISHRSIIPRYIYYDWLLIYSFNFPEPLLTWWKGFKVKAICIKDFTAKGKNEKKKTWLIKAYFL